MKTITIATLLMGVLGLTSPHVYAQTDKDDVPVNLVIEKINNSLSLAQGSLSGVSLEGGSVTLQTTYVKSVGGGIKFFVRAKKNRSQESSTAYAYHFAKPSATKAISPPSDGLTEILSDAAAQYVSMKSITGLVKDSFEVEVSFVVMRETDGGIEFKLFDVVELEGGGKLSKKDAHTIKLKFK